ncbi:hypothetical protein CYMTET_53593 [Cymbomonas tetramitiformis]|uniref:Protein kinase domain-containing protein n=1 Tax=Cymbomonas tetramitiformis TaxID=36881 RepID=A0AAE0EQF8_9CHLO|nr:hypothetical protein CYMTET_53593 [Cymbomonas tetramitiformis]
MYRGSAKEDRFLSVWQLVPSDRLYQGKYSAVFSASYKPTGENVALKVYKKEGIIPAVLRQVATEARSLRKLRKHKNIVDLLGHFSDERYIYIVQDLAEGGDLKNLSSSHPEMIDELFIVETVLLPLISALKHVHSRNLVHRDIKPENISFDSQGCLKLIDFGVAYDLDNAELCSSCVGTLDYMAPEVVAVLEGYTTGEPIKFGIDTWSVGILLHELLCGNPPFEVESEEETRALIMTAEYHEVCPRTVSPLAADLIGQILAKHPADRIQLDEIEYHPWVVKTMETKLGARQRATSPAARRRRSPAGPSPRQRQSPPSALQVPSPRSSPRSSPCGSLPLTPEEAVAPGPSGSLRPGRQSPLATQVVPAKDLLKSKELHRPQRHSHQVKSPDNTDQPSPRTIRRERNKLRSISHSIPSDKDFLMSKLTIGKEEGLPNKPILPSIPSGSVKGKLPELPDSQDDDDFEFASEASGSDLEIGPEVDGLQIGLLNSKAPLGSKRDSVRAGKMRSQSEFIPQESEYLQMSDYQGCGEDEPESSDNLSAMPSEEELRELGISLHDGPPARSSNKRDSVRAAKMRAHTDFQAEEMDFVHKYKFGESPDQNERRSSLVYSGDDSDEEDRPESASSTTSGGRVISPLGLNPTPVRYDDEEGMSARPPRRPQGLARSPRSPRSRDAALEKQELKPIVSASLSHDLNELRLSSREPRQPSPLSPKSSLLSKARK